jgi:hypothetical protein
MLRWCWVGVVLLVALTGILVAKPGVIKTTDGRSLEGDIDDTGGTSVNITTHGVTISVDRTDIDTITYTDDLESEFNNRMATLAPTDITGRLDLARWALDHQQYSLAQQAADSANTIEPGNPDVATMIATIQSTEAMQARQQAAATQVSAEPTESPATMPSMPKQFLSQDDINIIRQSELRDTDTIQVAFLNDVRNRFINARGLDPATFNNLSDSAQAMAIIQNGNPTLARDVRILSDPASMQQYRSRIEPRLLAGCAASGCHGGTENNGGFFLYPHADSIAISYTNFYILQTYKAKVMVHDVFGDGKALRPLIDPIHPEESPLIQFCLPQNQSPNPHPSVKGYAPLFTGTTDANYAAFVDWMGTMLKPIAPDYGIQFQVPSLAAPVTPAEGSQNSSPATAAPEVAPAPAENAPASESSESSSMPSAPPTPPATMMQDQSVPTASEPASAPSDIAPSTEPSAPAPMQ